GVPAARRVELQSAVDMFTGHRFQVQLDQHFGSSEANCMRNGKHQADGSTRWTESRATAFADANGEVVLQSLAAGTACTIAVRDEAFDEVAKTAIELPAAGESRTVDVVIAGVPRHVHGRVLDENGAPVAAAHVQAQAGDRSCTVTTDRDGAFAFDRV